MAPPFALSIHKFIGSIGADVGFASIIAVAILILLYFAHARETATLRERLEEAQQHISGLEARIAALMQSQAAQRARAPMQPPAGPVPPGAVPGGAVRRVPSPVTAAATQAAPAAAQAPAAGRGPAVANGRGPLPPAAAAGTGGPALASATRVLSAPSSPAPDDTIPARPAAATAAAAGNGRAAPRASAATQALPASSRVPSASPRGAAAPAARNADDAPGPGRGAGGVRRIRGNPRDQMPSFGLLDDEPTGSGGLSGRMAPLLIAALAVVVIIAGLVVITNNGHSAPSSASQSPSGQTGAALRSQQAAKSAFKASGTTVAVLNGTATAGLAAVVGAKLAHAGYRKGNITNAASQTQARSFVYYVGGPDEKLNRVAATHVAAALSLPASRVRRAGHLVIESCSISAAGASLGSCTANVIVLVGQDRASLATG